MNNSDKTEFARIITPVAELYRPEKPLSKSLLTLYFYALKELTVKEFDYACKIHVTDTSRGRFMPKPADILYQHEKLQPKILTAKEQAVLAWPDVMAAITDYGKPNQPELDDITAQVVKNIGGLSVLILKTYDELVWVKKEFVEAYDVNCRYDQNILQGNIHKSLIDNVKIIE